MGVKLLLKDNFHEPGLSKVMQVKAKLLLLKLIHLFAREVLLVKKLEVQETKTT